MATSGRIETGRYNFTSFYLNWQIARQDIAGNFTDINYQTGINITNSAHWGNNAIIVAGGGIAGQGIAGGTFSNKRGNGDHQLTSGTIRVYHEGDGRKTVWIDLVGRFYVGGNLTAGQNFELPTIPRQSNPTFSKRLYTLGERIVVNMNRKAGFTHRGTIQIPDGNEIMSFRDQHDAWAWTPDQAKIQEIYRRMSNTTRTSLGVDITTWNGGTQIGGTGWENVEIQIPVEENRPDFANFGFIDQNTRVKALTGGDKIFIKGHSKIKMWVTQAQKMTTKNHATAKDYTANFGGVVVAKNETTTGAIDFIFENPVAESGNLIASISARDSRNLTTTASQTIAVLDYAKPAINAVAKRQNNFDQTTELDLSGNYTNFEGRNTILLVQYRVREVNGAWGAWKKPSFTASNGSWSVAKQFENFNRTSSYEIEVEARDRLEIVRTFITVGQGVPIAFISSNKKSVGIGKVPSLGGEGDLDVAGDVYSRGKKVLTGGGLQLVGVAHMRKEVNFHGENSSGAQRYIDWQYVDQIGDIVTPTRYPHSEAIGNNTAFIFNDDFDYIETELTLRPWGSVDAYTIIRPTLNTLENRGSQRAYIDLPKTGGGKTITTSGAFFNIKKGNTISARVLFLTSGVIGEPNQGMALRVKCYKYER